MRTSTFKWINVLAIALFAAALILLIISLTSSAPFLFGSVGWHEVASVGWVTVAG
jgi:hypothetical protein